MVYIPFIGGLSAVKIVLCPTNHPFTMISRVAKGKMDRAVTLACTFGASWKSITSNWDIISHFIGSRNTL
jgi:hypothetical protein